MNRVAITGAETKEMFANGYRSLCRAEKQVNDLNVFPIPDGDTGTNMLKTLGGGIFSFEFDGTSANEFMKLFARSVLLCARGNSGVILSQFIRGFADGCKEDVLDVPTFSRALLSGAEKAYDAVINPVEGTMLTVIREGAEAFAKNSEKTTLFGALSFVIDAMQESLRNTPEKLPVLKEAGVVDSGGLGIIYIFEGMKAYFEGKIIEADEAPTDYITQPVNAAFGPDSVLEYGYCTEFILQLMNAKTNIENFNCNEIIQYLQTIGDSIVAVQDGDVVKVHVHTFTPDKALGFARNYGEFISVKIENMSIQHNELMAEKKKHYKYAVVAVATGDGLESYFKEIGAAAIINGGQTNNPSAQDFIDVFNSLDAEHIIVLPNNSNIILTAMQAKEICADKDIHIIPTKSVVEGYSALSMMDTSAGDVETFIENMTAFLPNLTSASITVAVHDAQMNGVTVKEGEYMGIADGKIISSSIDRNVAIMEMLEKLPDIDDKQVITIFTGKGVSENESNEIAEKIMEQYPLIEVGCIYGGQELYDFYMAIE